MGVLCNPRTPAPGAVDGPQAVTPRYQDAIKLCNLVESAVFQGVQTASDSTLVSSAKSRPLTLPYTFPISHYHRLQNLFFVKGNLYTALNQPVIGKGEYEKGLEMVISPPKSRISLPHDHEYTLRDLMVAAILAGLSIMSNRAPERPNDHASRILAKIGIVAQSTDDLDYLNALSEQKNTLLQLLEAGGGVLPLVLLTPDCIAPLAKMVFSISKGVLPAIGLSDQSGTGAQGEAMRRQAADSCNQTTSTILLTFAKIFQDAVGQPNSPVAVALTRQNLPPSHSLILPLYYLSLSLHPSPSTYNNLGILLSTISSATVLQTSEGPRTFSGQALAMKFYQAGLEKDSKHPHLYTNLGSLLKDLGNLPKAIEMYKQAVSCNPSFDV